MAHPKAGRPREGAPVKYIAAILAPRGFDLERLLLPLLEERFGGIDHRGEARPFGLTDYYEDEMGPDLHRTIVSFEPLRAPTELVEAKLSAAAIEERLSGGGNRRANVDVGYLDFFKVVLASFKEGPQKIYLGKGVYADPILLYNDGAFDVLPWTFPDFRTGVYAPELAAIREKYRQARR